MSKKLKKRDWFQIRTGEKREKLFQRETAEEIIQKRLRKQKSQYPLRSLGMGSEGHLFLSEEERESHMHVIGTTGEGKSKFLEHLIRGDIDLGNGLTLLDPSDRGDTVYKVLRYCLQRGHKKVLLIDPHHRYAFGKIPKLNPFKSSYRDANISNVMDTIRVLFNTKDAAEIPRINRYLPALLSVLLNAEMSLH